jgi:hypothetical protein
MGRGRPPAKPGPPLAAQPTKYGTHCTRRRLGGSLSRGQGRTLTHVWGDTKRVCGLCLYRNVTGKLTNASPTHLRGPGRQPQVRCLAPQIRTNLCARRPMVGFYLPKGKRDSRIACRAKGPRLRRREAARNSHRGEVRKRQQLADAGLSLPVGPTRKDLRNACT